MSIRRSMAEKKIQHTSPKRVDPVKPTSPKKTYPIGWICLAVWITLLIIIGTIVLVSFLRSNLDM